MIPLLQINNLSIGFPQGKQDNKAIHEISLSVQPGQTLGIVGESGSGKSLTSLAIMRLLSKQAVVLGGEILLHLKDNDNLDLIKLSEKELQKLRGNRIAMIFQEPMTALNPVVLCGKQVSEVLLLHTKMSKKEAKLRTIQLFEEVQLSETEKIYNSYPHQLSGGQKQRILIAMAMACQPALLIADEPTTALDASVQQAILELIKQLKEKHKTTTLFISHDLNLVSNFADQVAVIYQGKIVEYGRVQELFSNPKHPYTKGLLFCRPPSDKRLIRLPLMEDFLSKAGKEINESAGKFLNEISLETRRLNHEKLYTQKPLLEVQNLVVSFPIKKSFFGKTTGEMKAVDDVSFSVYPGETLGLVGESGCGKTTLSRAIVLLNAVDSGSVCFENQNILNLSPTQRKEFRKNVQIIFQDPYGSLNPRISIGEAILEPMTAHYLLDKKERKNQVFKLLEMVGLEKSSFIRYPHEFSGGQRQRISIARALAVNPKFIICDESVSSLDVSVQAQILNLLNDLKQELGLTYLFISHDLAVVKYMSDRVMVMKNGKLVETNEADDLFFNPKHEYTKLLLRSISKLSLQKTI
jgi:peptide/nickel transport system ATP-binding protein